MAAATHATPDLPQASLYVGDLHPLTTDAVLHAKFSEIGPVLNTRVCRDLATRNSLGYAYVNYEEHKDAERALENLNYETFYGRPIRIMWSQRDPALRKSGKGNIFIKNLDKSIEQKELYDTFNYFGKILSCKIAMDEQGKSKGYGFVHFEKEECAERAIEKLNHMSIRQRVIYVGKFIPNSDRKPSSGSTRFNNIYVKNFDLETTDEQLRDLFKEFGDIKSCCVEKNSDGKSKGFGFVCFAEPDDAERAVKAMHGKEVNGRQLYAGRAQRKEERQEEIKQRLEKQKAERQSKYISGVNLYVKNLDDSIDDDRLKDAFSQYGPITSAKVMTDANGRSKGFGFVCFTQPDQAARAVTEMNANLLGSKPLYVALAQRKEDRRAKLIAEHQQRLAHHRNNMNPMFPATPAHAAAAGYFAPAAFPAPRFYNPANAVINSQPRWNRAAGMGIPGQLGGGVPARQQMAGHYLGPNQNAGLTNHMAAMAQLRSPAGRPMLPNLQAMQGGPSLPGTAMINQSVTQRQNPGRPTMQQVMAQPGGLPQRPSMASVVAAPANANAHIRPANQVPRGVLQQGINQLAGPTGNVRFNQTARNVGQSTVQYMPLLAPLGDQSPLTMNALAQLSEDEQKRTLGERLFPMVQEFYPATAQKLTGMLLGVDIPELLHLLDSKEALQAKLEEGMNVLKTSRTVPSEQSEDVRVQSDTMGSQQPGQNGDGSANMNESSKTEIVGTTNLEM